MVGRVVSIKNKNTATVLTERLARDPLYKKTYLQSKKYLVDDRLGVKLGDIVNFINCKPISKRKSFKITKVLGKSFAEIAEIELKEKAEQAIAEVMPEEKKKGEGESGKGEESKTDKIRKTKEKEEKTPEEKRK